VPFARVPDHRHPGRADGEALRPGWIAQPVSAGSSVALAVGALALGRALTDARGVDALVGRALAAALAANAAGSAGFHGPGDRLSRRVHDLSLAAMVTSCAAGVLLGLNRQAGASLRALATPAGLLITGALVARRSRTGRPWCRPQALLQGHAVWHVLAAAGVTLAGRRMLAGRVTD